MKGKKVIVFPDTDAQDDWTRKLSGYGFKISTALIDNVPENKKSDGLDIADFIKPIREECDMAGNLIDPEFGYPVTWKTATPLQRMQNKYPNLKLLVERLDLVPM